MKPIHRPNMEPTNNLTRETEHLKFSNGEIGNEMEENQDNRVVANGVINECWFWAAASTAQLGWGVVSLKKGYAGHSNLMPLKAFAVASLFVGAASTAAVATLHLSGIHSVEDLKTLGANIRSACKNTR